MKTESERRRGIRIKTLLKAYFLNHDKHEHKLITLSFSRTGAFFHSNVFPQTGTELDIIFPPRKERKHSIILRGKVTRLVLEGDANTPYPGFGVQWCRVSSGGGKDAVENFLKEIYQSSDIEFFIDKGLPPDK